MWRRKALAMSDGLEVKVKVMEGGCMPVRGTVDSAGLDLFAFVGKPGERVAIEPGDVVMVGTGVAFQPPKGTVGLLFNRSGVAFRRGLSLVTGVSVIDSDYTGEIMCAFRNLGDETQYVVHGERIAQIVFMRLPEVSLKPVRELEHTDRGGGGFGSTGR